MSHTLPVDSKGAAIDELRGKINTLIYEVTDSDDVVKQLADLLVPFLAQEVKRARIDELKKIVDLPNIQIPAGIHVQARYVSAVEERIKSLERLG